jgi:hypothetical protein
VHLDEVLAATQLGARIRLLAMLQYARWLRHHGDLVRPRAQQRACGIGEHVEDDPAARLELLHRVVDCEAIHLMDSSFGNCCVSRGTDTLRRRARKTGRGKR